MKRFTRSIKIVGFLLLLASILTFVNAQEKPTGDQSVKSKREGISRCSLKLCVDQWACLSLTS
jgi:hypothetical protein